MPSCFYEVDACCDFKVLGLGWKNLRFIPPFRENRPLPRQILLPTTTEYFVDHELGTALGEGILGHPWMLRGTACELFAMPSETIGWLSKFGVPEKTQIHKNLSDNGYSQMVPLTCTRAHCVVSYTV